MSAFWIRGICVLLLAGGVGVIAYVEQSPEADVAQPLQDLSGSEWPGSDPRVIFSAPGVTEPSSRTLKIFSEVPGTISRIYVKSNDRIHQGQLLFELANETQLAEIRHCEALVRVAKAKLAKLESWERPEDRRIAEAQWQEAQALAAAAEFEWQRIEPLARQGAATNEELVASREAHAAANARAAAAKARYDFALNGPRQEDLEIERAAVAEAESLLDIARTALAKTRICSPIDGIVIYRHREPGEVVLPDIAQPVLSIGCRDQLHLRADVDETALAQVRINQRVFATAEAFGNKRFGGRVVHIEQALGSKNVRTYRPTEKVDTKILEVVILLDDGRELPLDLRMTVWFLRDEADSAVSKDASTVTPALTPAEPASP